MEKKIICSKCGQELDTTTVLDGLCPKCLMVAAGATENENTVKMGNSAGNTPDFSLEEIRKLFPNLEIIELLGCGGMGSVYKARQPSLERFVALKVIHPRIAQSPEFVERFKREAKTLAKLNHPNIVGVYDFGTSGNVCFLIMEYIDGVNLRQAIRQAKLKPSEVLEIVMRICDALQFAHEEGIVHRDIKPENILLDLKNRVKIVDFGLAKLVAGKTDGFSLTEDGKTMGTPDYEVVLRTLENEPERRYQQASQVRKDVETIVTNKNAPLQDGTSSIAETNGENIMGKIFALLGIIFVMGPFPGLFITIFSMVKSFSAAGSSGIVSPEILAHNISAAMGYTAVGLELFQLRYSWI